LGGVRGDKNELARSPVLKVVENITYLIIPGTDRRIEVSGKAHGEEVTK
jgi:hypothetical protein